MLDKLDGGTTVVLHDRTLPGSAGDLEHLVINGSGVFPIATKRYAGRLEVRALGTELWIGGRNRSRLLVQVRRGADVIRDLLADDGFDSVPVTPVICFVDTELPPFTTMRIGGVVVGTARNVRRHLGRSGEVLGPGRLAAIARALDTRLQPAARG